MTDSPILRLEGVGKKYSIREPRFVSRAARAALASWIYERKREMWALRDINFERVPGQMLGVIGLNGSGKSTLLKLIAGVSTPTEGRIVARGSMVGLLELGAGFHPDLTGYQNVYLQGNLIGLNKAEIDGRLEEIVEFSGLGPFMEWPVKRYSSGMYARLGFSLALHSGARIVLIDEILAVGDAEFQRRGLNRIREIQRRGDTIFVLVTHNLALAQEYCDEVIWLDGGVVRQRGGAREVCASYFRELMPANLETLEYGSDITAFHCAEELRDPDSPLRIVGAGFVDAGGNPVGRVAAGETVALKIEVDATHPLAGLDLTAFLVNESQIVMAELSSEEIGQPVDLPAGRSAIRMTLEPQLLLCGDYAATILIAENSERRRYLASAFRQGLFQPREDPPYPIPYSMRHPHQWTFEMGKG